MGVGGSAVAISHGPPVTPDLRETAETIGVAAVPTGVAVAAAVVAGRQQLLTITR